MTCWKVNASKEVRMLGKTRRRTVDVGGERRTLEFGQEPVFLDCLPPEIKADEHLVKVKVPHEEAAAAGPNFVRLLDTVQTSAPTKKRDKKEEEEAARQELLRRQAEQGGAATPSPETPHPVPESPPAAPAAAAPAKPVQL